MNPITNPNMSKEDLAVAADSFLRTAGIYTDFSHNAIILNLYMNNPTVNYVEYFFDADNARIKTILHIDRARAKQRKKTKSTEEESTTLEILAQYLPDFDIEVEVITSNRRLK